MSELSLWLSCVYNRPVRYLLLVLLLALPGTSYAQGVRALALPATKGHEDLRKITRQVAQEVAQSLGQERVKSSRSVKLGTDLRDAIALAQAGQLEEASRALQTSVSTALDAPHTLPGDAPLFEAMTQLASIALAAGDQERADALFQRVLQFDPAFQLPASQRSPRTEASLRRASAEAGRSHSLALSVVGNACADGVSVLIVGRGRADGSLELTRFDNCRLIATVQGSAKSKPEELAAALDPNFAAGTPGDKPLYKKGWFWLGTSTAALVGGAALFLVLRDDGAQPRLDINPIL